MTLSDLLITIGPYPAVSRITTSPPPRVWAIAAVKLRQGAVSEHVGLASLPVEATNVRCAAANAPVVAASSNIPQIDASV